MIKKPNFIVYYLLRFISILYNKFKLNNKFIKNELKHVKGPIVVLCTHCSSHDQMLALEACKRRMNFVVADSTYYSKYYKLMKLGNVIHKKQFFSTLREFTEMKSILNNNGIIAIYPQGLCTSDGYSTTLPKATGKFIKFLNVDTYIIKSYGMYLSNPKWSKILRKGRVETEVYKLFSKEDLKNKTSENIYDILNDELKYDDYIWQQEKKVKYKNGVYLEGLENVLYSCPICNSRFSISNLDNSLKCNICKESFKFNEYSMFDNIKYPFIKNPIDWHNILINNIINNIKKGNFEYTISGLISKLDRNKCSFIDAKNGDIIINCKSIKIIINNEIIYDVSIKHFFSLPMIPGEYFDLQDENNIYRIYPNNLKDVSYIADIVIAFYKINNEKD